MLALIVIACGPPTGGTPGPEDPPNCGDGVVQESEGETCDDGPSCNRPFFCQCDCSGQTPPVCGNGIQENGEACDDGDTDNCTPACNSGCTGDYPMICGDGVVECGEICDDGTQCGQEGRCQCDCLAISVFDPPDPPAGPTCFSFDTTKPIEACVAGHLDIPSGMACCCNLADYALEGAVVLNSIVYQCGEYRP
jgi:hypothetical protein